MEYPRDACLEVRAALPLFVGRDLESEELNAVEDHLAGCPACQEVHGRARTARGVLLEHRVGTAPDLWTGVRTALRDEGRLAPVGPVPADTPPADTAAARRRFPLRLVPVGGLSAAAAVLFAFLLAGSMGSTSSEPLASTPGPAENLGRGGAVSGAVPVDHRQGGLRPVLGDEEPMYRRARELRAEQGVVVPRSHAPRSTWSPAGLRRTAGDR